MLACSVFFLLFFTSKCDILTMKLGGKTLKEALTSNTCIVLLKRLHYSPIEILANPSSPSRFDILMFEISNITCSVNQAPHILGHSVAGFGLLAPPPHDFLDPPHQRVPLPP